MIEESERQAQFRNAMLTIAVFAPLLFAFIRDVNFYPLSTWSMFSEASPLGSGPYDYMVLKGQTVDGRVIEIPPIKITNALLDRNHSLARLTERNTAFFIHSPHPANVRLWTRKGTVPPAARMPALLEAWGDIYNDRLPEGSPNLLRAIILEKYEWPRVNYSDFDQLKQTWRFDLQTP